MSQVWIDGRFLPKTAAAVSVFDHGLLYGDGVWEGLRVASGEPLLFDEHLDDLEASAAALQLPLPLSRAEWAAAVREVLAVNGRRRGYVRLIVTRGAGSLGPDPRKNVPCAIVIAEDYWPFPPELARSGVHAVTATLPSHGPRFLGQPHLVTAKIAALQRGCLEAVLVDPAGQVRGATEGQVLARSGERLLHPAGQAADAHARMALAWAAAAGLIVVPKPLTITELLAAEEVMIVGTAAGVVPLTRIDDAPIGDGQPGPLTRQWRSHWENLAGIGYDDSAANGEEP